ncbi:MAG: hypothetical protein NZ551_09200 [Microscillaceae bacterium]|nr:hypothetical protein [Microscillaceae bacterium]MDW8461376.1 hypothetical protein [Cytophagales bacterium]
MVNRENTFIVISYTIQEQELNRLSYLAELGLTPSKITYDFA